MCVQGDIARGLADQAPEGLRTEEHIIRLQSLTEFFAARLFHLGELMTVFDCSDLSRRGKVPHLQSPLPRLI